MRHFSSVTIQVAGREVQLELRAAVDDDGIATGLEATVEGAPYALTAAQREWFLAGITQACVEGADEPRELDDCPDCHRARCGCDEIYNAAVDK